MSRASWARWALLGLVKSYSYGANDRGYRSNSLRPSCPVRRVEMPDILDDRDRPDDRDTSNISPKPFFHGYLRLSDES
jgi:hypothetical protein